VQSFVLERARVRSRAKLSFAEVDALFERGSLPQPVRKQEAVEASLRAMGELGPLRAHHEERKQVARYRRVEAEVKLDASGSLRVGRAPRGAAELANEQLSILCNALGGRYLRDALAAGGTGAHVQPVYRVHEPPAPERVEGFERLVARLARSRGLPDDPWVYRQAADAGLAGYLDALPTEGDAGRLARALHRQAMLLQGRSRFSADEAGHHGVGEAVYSRFTAPMREIVGVYCHTQAIERLVGEASRPDTEDVALRDEVIDAANRAKDQQRRLDREVDRWTLEAALAPELARPFDERPEHTATVMGVSSSRLHLLLDHVPLDVTLLFYDLGQALGGAWLEQADEGARVAVKATGKTVCHLGDQVAVRALKPGAVVLSGASLDRARLALRR
jgi:ribonuclease R